MSAPLHRQLTPWLAAASLVSWGVALWQSLPRLMAGPICTSNNDLFAFAGHCPACFVAAGFTAALAVNLVADGLRTQKAAQA
ncbi:hypothetical protein P7B02_09705 [Caulobacter segnis]|uniref:hypothetical protein n=1 Tax=Caulobacter segnis TaxID=88688 RepID=UPI00240FC82A|nr:hypothetical protein [Caulobacter segnis]MDG2521816.1 hypothetical protein [Caulobacter segnis]